jgi:hypothetical protein
LRPRRYSAGSPSPSRSRSRAPDSPGPDLINFLSFMSGGLTQTLASIEALHEAERSNM